MNEFLWLMKRELEALDLKAKEEDERMAAAARGGSFWRSGPTVKVVGLAEFLPKAKGTSKEPSILVKSQKGIK